MTANLSFGGELARLRLDAGISQRALSKKIFFSNSALSLVESNKRAPSSEMAERLDRYFGTGTFLQDLCVTTPGADALHQNMISAFVTSVMTRASVEEWETDVLFLGEATRFEPHERMLSRLRTNIEQLQNVIEKTSNGSSTKDLSRLGAELGGLMSLTLLKYGEESSSLSWARTARMFAAESGDPETRSWATAQEAYWHYYAGDITSTIAVAKRARDVVSRPRVGVALAAAVEARAHSLRGNKQDALRAIGNTENCVSRLGGVALTSSAFGYNEAQLRFHEENVLTRLGQTQQALQAQDRALALCGENDYVDRALVMLDRADCLIASGDFESAVNIATSELSSLTPSQRQGMLLGRAAETHELLRDKANGSGAAPLRELGDLIENLNSPA